MKKENITEPKSRTFPLSVEIVSDDIISAYEAFIEFVEFDDIGHQRIIFTTATPITEFRFIAITMVYDDDYTFYLKEQKELYIIDTLFPCTPFVVTWMEWGTMPHRGISFIDNKKQKRYFSINANNAEPEECDRGYLLLFEHAPALREGKN
jgi:hypothetical protein